MNLSRNIAVGVAFIFLIAAAGCYTTPGYSGYIRETVSGIDSSRHITMSSVPIGESALRLGLYKNSKMPAEAVLLVIEVQGSHDFRQGSQLNFKLDGELYAFQPYVDPAAQGGKEGVNVSVYVTTSDWSSERYGVTRDFLKRLYSASQAVVRIDLPSEFFEGRFQTQYAVTELSAVKSFCERIDRW